MYGHYVCMLYGVWYCFMVIAHKILVYPTSTLHFINNKF